MAYPSKPLNDYMHFPYFKRTMIVCVARETRGNFNKGKTYKYLEPVDKSPYCIVPIHDFRLLKFQLDELFKEGVLERVS